MSAEPIARPANSRSIGGLDRLYRFELRAAYVSVFYER